MKRPSVISPILLLTLTAAVGAGYLPTADPFEMFNAASSAMTTPRNMRPRKSKTTYRNAQVPKTQRLAARQWLDHVVKTFCNHSDHQHVTRSFNVGHFTTPLPTLHRLGQSHIDRVLPFDHHAQSQCGLLNLPPPVMV